MKKTISILLSAVILCGVLMFPPSTAADTPPFTVAGAIGHMMVLQRDADIVIWGDSASPGSVITVTFKGETAYATVSADGAWRAVLPPMAADSTESTLTVSLGDYTKSFTKILVGDVWIVSGQSNAALALSETYSEYPQTELNAQFEKNGRVRYYMQTADMATASFSNMTSPQSNPTGGYWMVENAMTHSFSALGYFFADRIEKEADVPVGVICVAAGGALISELMPAQALADAGVTTAVRGDVIPLSGFYNALCAPFTNLAIKGMLFYQGEGDHGIDSSLYINCMNAYVTRMREIFASNFPFYYVQVSSYAGTGVTMWPQMGEMRAAQYDALSVLTNSHMAVSMDCGSVAGYSNWAHPPKKKPIADRLASLALANTYSLAGYDKSDVESPMPVYAYKTDGGIAVEFENVGDGLCVAENAAALYGFRFITPSGYTDAPAELISSDTVLLCTESTDGITGVAYGVSVLAYSSLNDSPNTDCIANLQSSNLLPAPAFRLTTIQDGASPSHSVGDVTMDFKVNSSDVLTLRAHVSSALTLSAEALAFADMNGDIKINASDLLLLRQIIL